MGNPSILSQPPSAPPASPPTNRVSWTVFRLRDRGVKLAPAAVLRTRMVGALELARMPDSDLLIARLWGSVADVVIANLWDARVIRYRREGGLLLYGVDNITVRAGDYPDVPQAWWCLVSEVRERPPA